MIFQFSLASPRMCRQFPSGRLQCHQLFRLNSPALCRRLYRRASRAVLLVVSPALCRRLYRRVSRAVLLVVSPALCRRLYRRVSRVHRQAPFLQRRQARYLQVNQAVLRALYPRASRAVLRPPFQVQCPPGLQAANHRLSQVLNQVLNLLRFPLSILR